MGFVTDSNRPKPLWQPPPTACLTASGAACAAMRCVCCSLCAVGGACVRWSFRPLLVQCVPLVSASHTIFTTNSEPSLRVALSSCAVQWRVMDVQLTSVPSHCPNARGSEGEEEGRRAVSPLPPPLSPVSAWLMCAPRVPWYAPPGNAGVSKHADPAFPHPCPLNQNLAHV